MHTENFETWNNDLYKNVKKDRATYVKKDSEEYRMINTVGFFEMLLELENSPFYFSFNEKDKLMIHDTRSNEADYGPVQAESGTGKGMLKKQLKVQLKDKYKDFDKQSEDNYNVKDGGPTAQQTGFENLQRSFYSMANTLNFDMNYRSMAYLV